VCFRSGDHVQEAQYFNPSTRQWSTVYFPIPDASASTALIGDYIYQTVRVYNTPQKLVRTRITINTGVAARAFEDGPGSAPISASTSTVAVMCAMIACAIVVAVVVVATKRRMSSSSATPLYFSTRRSTDEESPDDAALEWDNADVGMPTPLQVELMPQQLPQCSPTLSRRNSPKTGRKVVNFK